MTRPSPSESIFDLNVPNTLSLARLMMAPVVTWGLLREEYLFCIVLLLLAALTDILDGLWARSFHERTSLGTVLDPLADKVFFLSVFLTMGWGLGEFPRWFAYGVIARDLLIVTGYVVLKILRRPSHVDPTLWGKLYTAVLFALVLCRLIALHFELILPFEMYALYGVTGLLGMSLFSYVKEFARRVSSNH